jgi:CheY-like chemotaxis protein/HPt (histidine-containing phosphotransfer) domain-containing protein
MSILQDLMKQLEIMEECQRTATLTPLQARCRVLLVDDCPDTVRLLQAYLADPGIALTVARDGREGIEAFKRAALPFNLVFMDMEMPVLDGYAATAEIRRWETENRLPRTPVAALTAISDVTAAKRILAAGCALHLTKPILRQTLLQVVRQYGAPRMPAPELLADFMVTCRSELMCLVDALDASDLASITRTGRRIRSSGRACGLSAICEIGASLEQAPNLGAALYGMEKLRCCLNTLDDSRFQGASGSAASGSGESIETQVIRELLPEYIASMLEKIRLMMVASQCGDYEQIKTIANQLKGTGNAFGLPTVSDAGMAIRSASEQADDLAVARHLFSLSRFLGSFAPTAPEKPVPAAAR